ncbi:acyl-CoA dehydrogenase family protein [Pseudomonas typographi]|uniref:Acyl-CoA/acyl-ACP dehydrogenase n=1 Tax=Pseudomonas typographi TaxID=2715964 RepID=A0ABR7YWU6_9PSED|nr:acyl-CoA dehydrogenase family protein [Pseudomonas typographi]MBD1552592.1 acyl-CoA/acyl-ACP dehydrogenase [Pseudomonas typographi]MBD1586173.1 acyl-CoA/acyl-ACP dehydrogenase [Pseudomonas typographi]MBD1597644.1 acyl-CoA/acyl-ACP dehydrogenase [Pseudomonas typographi]
MTLLDEYTPRALAPVPLLDAALLARIGERAAHYDQHNSFFHEDLAELRQAGYLKALVPEVLGGAGLTLQHYVREHSQLAARAPATALAINMHQYWVGTAARLWADGDPSLQWILREAAAGKVFAAGHGEPGSDAGLADSTVKAIPLGGGRYRFEGRKVLTSLSPVWDWLGIHGRDDTDPANPQVVHAFIARSSPGHRSVETWDALGLRATRSDDTLLEGVVAEADQVALVQPVGPPDTPFTNAILAAAIPGIAAVYLGIAQRAFDLAVASARQRTSLVLGGKTFAHKPLTQHAVAQAAITLDSARALLYQVAADLDGRVDHGPLWAAKVLAAKQHTVEAAQTVVNLALEIAGAASLSRRNELERLYRDVRAGGFHPPNAHTSYEVIGQSYLLADPA